MAAVLGKIRGLTAVIGVLSIVLVAMNMEQGKIQAHVVYEIYTK